MRVQPKKGHGATDGERIRGDAAVKPRKIPCRPRAGGSAGCNCGPVVGAAGIPSVGATRSYAVTRRCAIDMEILVGAFRIIGQEREQEAQGRRDDSE